MDTLSSQGVLLPVRPAWAAWVGATLALVFVGIYIWCLLSLHLRHSMAGTAISKRQAKRTRWSLMFIAVTLNLLPHAVRVDWSRAFIQCHGREYPPGRNSDCGGTRVVVIWREDCERAIR